MPSRIIYSTAVVFGKPTKTKPLISRHYMSLNISDKILCRGCGIDLASSQNIISKLSPSSQQSFLDTLFNTENVLIQILLSEFFFNFPVITTTHSSCVGVGEVNFIIL